jgi:hypothetical protein
MWYEFLDEGPDNYLIDEGDSYSNITAMILNLNMIALETTENSDTFRIQGAYTTVMKVQHRLTSLQDICIQFSHEDIAESDTYNLMYGRCLTVSYAGLAAFLENVHFEDVRIHAWAVNRPCYRASVSVTESDLRRFRAEEVEPLHISWFNDHVHTFPNVRRFVAPQEAFVTPCLDPELNWRLSPLLRSVECLEIIDSTSRLNHWARYVPDLPTEFPRLKRVVLWCDRLSVPLEFDTRLQPEPNHTGIVSLEVCSGPAEVTLNEHDGEQNQVSISGNGVTNGRGLLEYESVHDEHDDIDYESDNELIPEHRTLDIKGIEA